MSTFGITPNGFVLKRFSDIYDDLVKSYQGEFGYDLDVSDDSITGQEIGIKTKILTDLWEQAQARYFAAYPSTASDVSLDHAVEFSEISRLGATQSVVTAALRGDEGTIIPISFQASVAGSGYIFQMPASYTILKPISSLNIIEQYLLVDDLANSYSFTITINSIGYEITVNTSTLTEKEDVAAAITEAVNSNVSVSPIVVAIDFQNGAILLQSLSSENTWSLSNDDSNLSNWTPIIMSAMATGRITAPNFTLTDILTPVSGLDAINNFYPAIIGRETERDDALRLRRTQSIRKPGSSTLDGMKAKMINDVAGVIDCIVTEDTVAKTISFVVEGGTDADVAAKIWATKPGGILTVGTTSHSVIDSQNKSQLVNFSRPSAVPVYVQVSITKDPQAVFPSGGDMTIKTNVATDGNLQSALGKNIVVQKFLSSVYKVPGCGPVSLQMSIDNVNFSSGEISLNTDQYATFSTANVTVTIS